MFDVRDRCFFKYNTDSADFLDEHKTGNTSYTTIFERIGVTLFKIKQITDKCVYDLPTAEHTHPNCVIEQKGSNYSDALWNSVLLIREYSHLVSRLNVREKMPITRTTGHGVTPPRGYKIHAGT